MLDAGCWMLFGFFMLSPLAAMGAELNQLQPIGSVSWIFARRTELLLTLAAEQFYQGTLNLLGDFLFLWHKLAG